MNDSIDNLKKACIAIRNSRKNKESANNSIESLVESFLWANGIVCSVKLDYIDDGFPS